MAPSPAWRERAQTLLRSFLWRGHHRLAAFDDGQLGAAADAEGFADLRLDFAHQLGVVEKELLGVLASLAEAHVAVGEPRSRFLDDAILEADVDELAGLGDALAVTD